VHIIGDERPRFATTFTISLVSVASGDGVTGSTTTSGASVDPLRSAVNVSLMDRNYPYGLLQFAEEMPPMTDNSTIPVATDKPQVLVHCIHFTEPVQ